MDQIPTKIDLQKLLEGAPLIIIYSIANNKLLLTI